MLRKVDWLASVGLGLATLAVVPIAMSGPALATGGTADTSISVSQATSTSEVLAPVPTDVLEPQEITITGEPDFGPATESVSLDGEYVIAVGGTRTTAVLGAVTFDSVGTVLSGTISIVDAGATITPLPTPITDDLGSGDVDGVDVGVDPIAPPPSGSATVTDCTVTGGTYALSGTGAGEAQIEVDCGGSSSTVTWLLFVTASDGFSAAQQVRAVQLEIPSGTGNEIIDLILTLR